MTSAFRLRAAVLAAGASTRMGRPKALLEISSESALSRIVHVLRSTGFETPGIVIGAHREAVTAEVDSLRAQALVNRKWDDGRFSSVRCAAHWALAQEGVQGLLLWPVDCPGVCAQTVLRLAEAFQKAPEWNHVPSHRGRGGHPVLLSIATLRAIANTEGDADLRDFVRGAKVDPGNSLRRMLDVDDPAVLENLDTPQDYRVFLTKNATREREPHGEVSHG